MTPVAIEHIQIDGEGRPWITGANTKVIEVVQDKLAYGWSAEEIHLQHPHLSLAQIHAALSYYYDHQVEIDSEIEKQLTEYDQLRSEVQDSPIRQKLRSIGKLK